MVNRVAAVKVYGATKLKRITANGNTRRKTYDLNGIETAKEFYEENYQPDRLPYSFLVDENGCTGKYSRVWKEPGTIPEIQMEILPDRKLQYLLRPGWA